MYSALKDNSAETQLINVNRYSMTFALIWYLIVFTCYCYYVIIINMIQKPQIKTLF